MNHILHVHTAKIGIFGQWKSFFCGQDISGVWTSMAPTLTVRVNEMSTTKQRGKEFKLMKDGKNVHVL